jgi:hypothetical protein
MMPPLRITGIRTTTVSGNWAYSSPPCFIWEQSCLT